MKHILLALCAALAGCTTHLHFPPEDAFVPAPKTEASKVFWLVVEDPAAECHKLFTKHMDYMPNRLACAGWSKDHDKCVIVTAKLTSVQVLGHEMRHCFEGPFHP